MKIVTSKPHLVYSSHHTSMVNEKIAKLMAIAREWGYTEDTPIIEYSLRGRIAGRAWLSQNRIQINPVLMVENFEDYIETTLVHEFAHIVAWNMYGEKGHGYDWKSVMWRFGVRPKRTHSYDTSNVGNNMTYYVYTCGYHTYNMATRSHNLIKKGRTYTCRICRTPIRFTGKVTSKAEVAEQRAK